MKTIITVMYELDEDQTVPEPPEGGKLLFSSEPFHGGDLGAYSRVFSEKTSANYSNPQLGEYNWIFLRHQQNWANDMLHARGHVLLNDIYTQLGLTRTPLGAIVGWVSDPQRRPEAPGFIDFGCWDKADDAGEILLNFNVQGPIWHLLA